MNYKIWLKRWPSIAPRSEAEEIPETSVRIVNVLNGIRTSQAPAPSAPRLCPKQYCLNQFAGGVLCHVPIFL
jgi:hypothetical protein